MLTFVLYLIGMVAAVTLAGMLLSCLMRSGAPAVLASAGASLYAILQIWLKLGPGLP